MQMCSVGAIEKAGASVLFWDPLNPWINFTLASRALWDESDQNNKYALMLLVCCISSLYFARTPLYFPQP